MDFASNNIHAIGNGLANDFGNKIGNRISDVNKVSFEAFGLAVVASAFFGERVGCYILTCNVSCRHFLYGTTLLWTTKNIPHPPAHPSEKLPGHQSASAST